MCLSKSCTTSIIYSTLTAVWFHEKWLNSYFRKLKSERGTYILAMLFLAGQHKHILNKRLTEKSLHLFCSKILMKYDYRNWIKTAQTPQDLRFFFAFLYRNWTILKSSSWLQFSSFAECIQRTQFKDRKQNLTCFLPEVHSLDIDWQGSQ